MKNFSEFEKLLDFEQMEIMLTSVSRRITEEMDARTFDNDTNEKMIYMLFYTSLFTSLELFRLYGQWLDSDPQRTAP